MLYIKSQLRDEYGVEFTDKQRSEFQTLMTGLEDHMKVFESAVVDSPSDITIHLTSDEIGEKDFKRFVDDTIYMVERLEYFELVEDKEIRNKFGEWRVEYTIAFTGE